MENKDKSFVVFFLLKEELCGKRTFWYESDDIGKSIIASIFEDDGRYENSNNKIKIKKNKEQIFSTDENTSFAVRIIIHSAKELYSGQTSDINKIQTFGQEFLNETFLEGDSLKDFYKSKGEDYTEVAVKFLPIIHITLVNDFTKLLYEDSKDKINSGREGEEVNNKLLSKTPRSFQVMDSSVWNTLVPLDIKEIDGNDYGGKESLYDAINCIYDNYKKGIYNLAVATEYADLNARLACQSCLSGSHASGVSPLIFHSESAIKLLITKELRQAEDGNLSTTNKISNHSWRILLVDDKAQKGLTAINDIKPENKEGKLPWNCKLTIIEDILKNHFENSFIISHDIKTFDKCDTNKKEKINGILIDYEENIENAKEALKKKEYDIILLDYLLETEKGNEYGYELLENIYNNVQKSKNSNQEIDYSKVEYKVGPHKRFFFIFISAYSTAVYERLLAEGLNRSEKYWHIAVGACPTNTPKLFLYNLLILMEKQLEDSGVDKLSPRGIFDIVNKIYGSAEGEDIGKSVRYRANKYYQKVLDLHYLYRKMLDDVDFPANESDSIFNTKGSVLITNFMKKNVNLGGLLEHLTQLVHLTAFGTVRQWPEMWEEYIYFKAQFNITQLEIDCDKQNWNAREHFNTLCVNIENHILDLKSDVK